MLNATERPLDRRIVRSRSSIERALMELLVEGRLYDELTVSEVAGRADLTRKTFYARFGSIDAVVLNMASELFESVLLTVPDEAYELPLFKGRLTHAILAELNENLTLLEILTTLCPGYLFLEAGRGAVASLLLSRFRGVNDLAPISDFDRDYLTHILATTLLGTITAWASRGFEDGPDQVADFAEEMLGPICSRIFRVAE